MLRIQNYNDMRQTLIAGTPRELFAAASNLAAQRQRQLQRARLNVSAPSSSSSSVSSGGGGDDGDARLDDLASRLGLEAASCLDRAWSSLSGGEAHRALLAVHVAAQPDVLLLAGGGRHSTHTTPTHASLLPLCWSHHTHTHACAHTHLHNRTHVSLLTLLQSASRTFSMYGGVPIANDLNYEWRVCVERRPWALDEPTAACDAASAALVEGVLAEYAGAILWQGRAGRVDPRLWSLLSVYSQKLRVSYTY